MADITHLKTDRSLEKDGVWVEIGFDWRVKVARAGNAAHQRMYQRLLTPALKRASKDPDTATPEELEQLRRINAKAMVGTVLLDWEGDENGQPLPFSEAKAEEYLRDNDWFAGRVAEASTALETFRRQEAEEAAGN